MIWQLFLMMAFNPGNDLLTLDMSFGSDNDEDTYIWGGQATHLSVDDAGLIYVADTVDNRVLCFDQQGEYVKTLAAKGSGPGEYNGLLRFRTVKGGGFVGLDRVDTSLTRNVYKADGSLAETTNGQMILVSATLSADGIHSTGFWVEIDTKTRQKHFKTGVLDQHLKVVKLHTDESGPLPDRSRFTQASYWVETLGRNIKRAQNMGVVHVGANGAIFTARRQAYSITHTDPTGKTNSWTHDRKPVPRTDGDMEAIIESATEGIRADPVLGPVVTRSVMRQALDAADLKPVKASIYAITTSEDGLVVVIDGLNHETRETHATLFEANGRMVGEISLPDFGLAYVVDGACVPRIRFKGKYAYTILTDEDGENSAARYHWRRP